MDQAQAQNSRSTSGTSSTSLLSIPVVGGCSATPKANGACPLKRGPRNALSQSFCQSINIGMKAKFCSTEEGVVASASSVIHVPHKPESSSVSAVLVYLY